VGVFVKAAGTWTEIAASKALINWAKVSGGTVTTYTAGDGAVMEVHTFTDNGAITVDEPGYANILLCGGGGSSWSGGTYGPAGGGSVIERLASMPSGSLAVTVGKHPGSGAGANGTPSIISGVAEAMGGGGGFSTSYQNGYGVAGGYIGYAGGGAGGRVGTAADSQKGLRSTISGIEVEYGKGGGVGVPATGIGAGGGQHGTYGGTNGIVIVAVQQTPPTVSGVAASGGAENDYTGDGSNGVLGQRYRVHRFTANGTLSVSQGGTIKYLVVGAGGGSNSPYTGNGGDVKDGSMAIVPGAMPVVVGLGGVDTNATGGPSSLGSILTSIATFCPSDVRATGAGGTVAAPNTGLTSRITGTAVEYARAGMESPPVNSGSGRHPNAGILPGASGCVIVRYEIGG